MINVNDEALKLENQIILWRRELHKIPELDLDLPQTASYVFEELNKMGIKSYKLHNCSGVVGLIKGKKKGKTIGLRADMDGLPIKEETGLAFASENGNMHACGHDAHTAMLLGAAKILKDNADKFEGNIKLIFQPGEEKSGGAKHMINEGVMENPKVDAVIGQHTGSLFPEIKNGHIGICYGNMMAAQDRFVITIKGKGCHGANPRSGIDPVVITAYVITALQTLVSREINATDCAVLTIGKINGGKAFNIIPDEVKLEGTVRALDNKIREKFEKRLKEIVLDTTKAMRAECEIEYFLGYPVLKNNQEMVKCLQDSASKVIGIEYISKIENPTMGSEDMAYFLEEVPGVYYILSSVPDGKAYPHHNSKFDLDESVLWKGAAILSQTAVDWLNK